MKNDSHFATLQSRETSIQTQCFEKYQKCLIKVEPILNLNSISFILDWKIPKLLSYKLQQHAIVSIPPRELNLRKNLKNEMQDILLLLSYNRPLNCNEAWTTQFVHLEQYTLRCPQFSLLPHDLFYSLFYHTKLPFGVCQCLFTHLGTKKINSRMVKQTQSLKVLYLNEFCRK